MTKECMIVPWSGKVICARKQYICEHCGGIIQKGTKYKRDVVRMGDIKYISPLRNVHEHTDCRDPWPMVEAAHLLPFLSTLGQEERPDRRAQVKATVNDPNLGKIIWTMPKVLSGKITQAGISNRVASHREIENILVLVARAVVLSAGDKRQAMRVSNALNRLKLVMETS